MWGSQSRWIQEMNYLWRFRFKNYLIYPNNVNNRFISYLIPRTNQSIGQPSILIICFYCSQIQISRISLLGEGIMNIARKHSSQDKICQVQGEFPYFLSSNIFKLMLLCIGDVRSRRHHGHLLPSIYRSAAPAPGGRCEPQLGAAAGPHH